MMTTPTPKDSNFINNCTNFPFNISNARYIIINLIPFSEVSHSNGFDIVTQTVESHVSPLLPQVLSQDDRSSWLITPRARDRSVCKLINPYKVVDGTKICGCSNWDTCINKIVSVCLALRAKYIELKMVTQFLDYLILLVL